MCYHIKKNISTPPVRATETQRRLGYVVRKIGEQGASVSGYVEQVLREHLDHYEEDVETWRKL